MVEQYEGVVPGKAFEEAVGRGTIYRVVAVAVILGLGIALILGVRGVVGPGLFTDQTAFAVGGIALAVIAAGTLVTMFSLTGTIRYINREMADLTRLRNAIESSYAKLSGATENLGREVGELRTILPSLRRLAAAQARREAAAARRARILSEN